MLSFVCARFRGFASIGLCLLTLLLVAWQIAGAKSPPQELPLEVDAASNAPAKSASLTPGTIGSTVPNIEVPDLASDELFGLWSKKHRATVVLFVSLECPVSNSYVAPLNALAKKYTDDVEFIGICPSGTELATGRKWAKEYEVQFRAGIDREFTAAKVLAATTTPEVFLLDDKSVLRYRGRIDNSYYARLKKNNVTTEHDLADAIDALLAGRELKTSTTKPIGCPIVFPDDAAAAKTSATVESAITFHRDIEPLLQTHCQTCHRPGEVGPFSLLTYEQAKSWAADIKQYTTERKMPPWLPRGGPKYQDERKLTTAEIATLAAWVDGGTPRGNPADAPAPKEWPTDWPAGQPDLILQPTQPFHLAATGKDIFRCFVIPTGLTQHQWIAGYHLRPGQPRVVHHTLHFFDTTGKAQSLEKLEQEQQAKLREAGTPPADNGPGYGVGMGIGFSPPIFGGSGVPQFGGLGGWAPGQRPQFLPPKHGWFLPQGADFIIQTHYHRDGKPAADQTQIGLYFAKGPIDQPWQSVIISGLKFLQFIPAGAENWETSGARYLTSDAYLHNVLGHMHLLGKSLKVTLTQPGQEPQILLEIPEWNYNWQETYWFAEPILAKAGSKLEISGVFDNSSKNPNNPSNPPKIVTRGEQTTDEMLFAFIGATSTAKPWKPVRASSKPPADEAAK